MPLDAWPNVAINVVAFSPFSVTACGQDCRSERAVHELCPLPRTSVAQNICVFEEAAARM